MRITSLLAATAAMSLMAMQNIGAVAIETVADDYDRPRPEPKPKATAPAQPKPVEESLRGRIARMDREAKDRRRAEAMRRAAENQSPVHRRNAP